ncbi:MAG: thioredoxin domain-containing protein [Cryobacterium sp.]|nr:thioredoxin domain-containing protein [Cryobacterium sp.]
MTKRGRRAQRGPAEQPRALAHVDQREQRRAQARTKARTLREQSRKKERRNRFLVQGGLIVLTLAIIGAVVFVLTTSPKPSTAGPANMLSDGIKIGENFEAVQTAGLRPSATPVPAEANAEGVLDIKIWVDYLCPLCESFDRANEAFIRSLILDGAATVEYHPIAILDRLSSGTRYSTRAANAAACVANYSPNEFFAFNSLMFEHQPEQNSSGLSDAAMIEITRTAGVAKASTIAQCIRGQEFKIWVESATHRALSQPVAGSQLDKINGTPTVLVNGQLYQYTVNPETREFNSLEFQAFINEVLGIQFTESVQPSPSPSPTPDVQP